MIDQVNELSTKRFRSVVFFQMARLKFGVVLIGLAEIFQTSLQFVVQTGAEVMMATSCLSQNFRVP